MRHVFKLQPGYCIQNMYSGLKAFVTYYLTDCVTPNYYTFVLTGLLFNEAKSKSVMSRYLEPCMCSSNDYGFTFIFILTVRMCSSNVIIRLIPVPSTSRS